MPNPIYPIGDSPSGPLQQDFLQQSIIRMNESTERIKICLDQLTEAQVWQKPNDNTNSIGNLILHLCGNITQYAIASLGNKKDERKRSLEFSTTGGYSKNELWQKMESTAQLATETVNNISESELLRIRNVQGFELSGLGIIVHVVEHYSYHTGQIALLTKLLTNKDLRFYGNMDLEITT